MLICVFVFKFVSGIVCCCFVLYLMYLYTMTGLMMFVKYLFIAVLFVVVDSVYLTSVSEYFNKQILDIQGSFIKLNMISAILCYIILTVGLFYFGVMKKMSYLEIFALGIFVYGVYETTNHAIIKNWRWMTVFMDTVWGGILFSSVVAIYRLVFE